MVMDGMVWAVKYLPQKDRLTLVLAGSGALKWSLSNIFNSKAPHTTVSNKRLDLLEKHM